jgi:hypothetical protein
MIDLRSSILTILAIGTNTVPCTAFTIDLRSSIPTMHASGYGVTNTAVRTASLPSFTVMVFVVGTDVMVMIVYPDSLAADRPTPIEMVTETTRDEPIVRVTRYFCVHLLSR